MGKNEIYAVVDTNVFVSALLSSQKVSNTTIVIREVLRGRITPLYNDEILDEYREVLSRDKFHIKQKSIETVLDHIRNEGLKVDRAKAFNEIFPDPKDIVFYEVTLSKDDAYLVTGNIKHFPKKTFVVTPSEMVAILNKQ